MVKPGEEFNITTCILEKGQVVSARKVEAPCIEGPLACLLAVAVMSHVILGC